jgi:hypothetical protein
MTPEERAFQVYEALHELPRGSWLSLILEAIREERERCAKKCDIWAKLETEGTIGWTVATELAAAIRSTDTETGSG